MFCILNTQEEHMQLAKLSVITQVKAFDEAILLKFFFEDLLRCICSRRRTDRDSALGKVISLQRR